jgi:hypothetical protein
MLLATAAILGRPPSPDCGRGYGCLQAVCIDFRVNRHYHLISRGGRRIVDHRWPAWVIQASVGVLLILNGPVPAFSVTFKSIRGAAPATQESRESGCCGCCRCGAAPPTGGKNHVPQGESIRPICPKCPCGSSCPGSACKCCCGKVPTAPPPAFELPDAPELSWYQPDADDSFFDSHPDEPTLPPRAA